jgi:uncharacterized protein (TIGR02996 family)
VRLEEAFLQEILAQPSDLTPRLAFADWLEEQGDPRAELLRLLHTLTQQIDPPERPAREARLRGLLESGVKPVGPFWTHSVGMQFACIPPGTFLMGSPPNDPDRRDYETQHRVTLTEGFCMGVHPVTQAQWQAIMGDNPSGFKGDTLPVETVSWDDCQEFVEMLGQRTGERFRLPTEAEWEYACRAGTTTAYSTGDGLDALKRAGWCSYDGKYRGAEETRPVGQFEPNAWGLYDMHGNVYEWCQDRYGPYEKQDQKDPKGSTNGTDRVLRGGSWLGHPRACRSAYRLRGEPGDRSDCFGCRVLLCLD